MKSNIDQPKPNIKCWDCCYCDKESVLVNGKWVLTRTGYCLAENSAVNGETDFYKKVYKDTIYSECSQYEFKNKLKNT